MTEVSIMAVRAVIAGVEDAGVARERFLFDAGLAPSQMADGHARVSWQEYCRVIRAALESSGDPALGLHMGERASTSWFDVLGTLATQSTTLRDALQMCARYSRLATDGPRLDLREDEYSAVVKVSRLSSDSPETRFVAEFSISALLIQLVRRFVGIQSQPRRVYFAHAAPAHHAEYTRIFGGCERFSHAFTGVELERAWLDREQLHHSPELQELLRSRAEFLLSKLDRDAAASDRVRRWLASQSALHKPSMDRIARDLGMSGRSLRRRLSAEGVCYSELLEDARAASAKRMLSDPGCSVQEAAYALGFSTQTAFTRAFKRWTGLSPSAYRTR